MIKETSYDVLKNSRGELSLPRHYIMDLDEDASILPADAPTGSDALSASGKVYIKFPKGWSAI